MRSWLLLLLLCALAERAAALPPGFAEVDVGSAWNEVAGLTFDANGRMYVWERAGRVWTVTNGVKSAAPLIDISDEVGGWRDFGLLGFALHPNFLANGQVFLYYVVDRHHLLYAGTPQYDPATNEYFAATTGRITRYTLSPADGFSSVEPGSRAVLAGATADDGCPILYESHGTGSLVFGQDGTLLAACGDGASYSVQDTGSVAHTYYAQALADGIISTKENVGAYRAQLVDSLSGKLWRIDPNTGLGVPGNPFYAAGNPGSKASRVWALGVRNPYRMTREPGTGSHEPGAGDPGTIYLGDVGWNDWEDLHVVKQGGQNLGWPKYEGMDPHSGYAAANTANLDAPNPLYDGTSCTQQYFFFRELVQQDSLAPSPTLPNACGGVITTTPIFVHSAPEVDWNHAASGPARSKTYTGNTLVPRTIGASGSPVAGASFRGNASTGGVWYTGSDFPASYQNNYFHADYGAGWIRNFTFDANDMPTSVQLFHDGADGVVHVATSPVDGNLYYVSWTSAVRRVTWVGLGNEPPNAVASADFSFGGTPLTVQFTGSGSSDPESGALTYLWSFGDGTTSSAANPLKTFTAPAGVPTAFDVSLTVTDPTALASVATLRIWVNDTPPTVEITSPLDGALYPLDAPTLVPLQANVSDAEHGSGLLACSWQIRLHHNEHVHSEPPSASCSASAEISPIGCDGNVYYYTATLTVTDPLGLAATDTATLYPDCPNVAPLALGDEASVAQGYSVAIDVLANDSDAVGAIDPTTVEITAPPQNGSAVADPLTGVVTYTHDGSSATADSFAYRVTDEGGLVSNVASVTISAFNTPPSVALTSPANLSGYTVGAALALAANASDAEDGVPADFHWQVDRIVNGALVPAFFVWDGRFPPAFVVPPPPAPGDRISYLVKLTVTDRVGRTASDEVRVNPASPPANGAPTAAFTRSPASGPAPLAVAFDAGSSSDPDGDHLTYAWSFGDGATASGPIVSHVYNGVANWNAQLTVTDAAGATAQASASVNVTPSGLRGDYYNNIDLTSLVLTRTDTTLDFDWGSGSPAGGIGVDTFSVRWTGRILPAYTETYTLYTNSDDGIRVWIDDVLVIDHWTDHAPTERSGTVAMTAGTQPAIRVEYYENGGGALAQLSWSSPSQAKQIVPAGRLFGPGASNLAPLAAADAKTVLHGASAQVALLANDSDPEGALDAGSVAVLSAPAHGIVSIDPATGVATYTHTGGPGESFDSFTYQVEDVPGLASAPATVSLALVPPPQVSITSPAPSQSLIGTEATLAYTLSGYAPFLGGARFRLDDGAFTTQPLPLSGAFGWSGLEPGPHVLRVELLSPALAPWTHAGAAAEVAITTDLDADSDGFGDAADNCPYVANDQSDAGGMGASGPDGIGDACQCGDLDGDGDADLADGAALRGALADPTGAALSQQALEHCSVSGDALGCDVLDVSLLARANATLDPPLVQGCAAALP